MPECTIPLALTLAGALIARTEFIAATYTVVLAPNKSIFSLNHKTTWSINLPAITCLPTPICASCCYAALLTKSSRWIKTVRKLLRVYNYFLQAAPEEAADCIYLDYMRLPAKRRPPFIRVCGTGDLFLELVLAINVLVRKHPEIRVWVATRRPDMVGLLDRTAANLFILFSLDSSPESRERMVQVVALDHPRVRFSYLRTTAKDSIPDCTAVVYNQQDKPTLPTRDRADLCPADAGHIPMARACGRCQRCFSEWV